MAEKTPRTVSFRSRAKRRAEISLCNMKFCQSPSAAARWKCGGSQATA